MTDPSVGTTASPSARPAKRRRRRFSLNALAIQLSAFALSFTLVALLVVSGSQAAFVEQSEAVAGYVPIGNAAPTAEEGRRPAPPRPAPAVPELPPAPSPEAPVADEVAKPPAEVQLTDSDAGTAMFRHETLLPGVAVDRCIEVTYDGTDDPGPVLLYAAANTGGDLAPYLDLTIHMGSAADGTFGTCGSFSASTTIFSGTLADFAAAHSSFRTGRFTWNPTGTEEKRSFRFSVALHDVAVAAGKSASFGFTWRAEDV